MSYRDPYSGHYSAAAGSSGRYQNNHPQYTDSTQGYSDSYPVHQTYDNMGGHDYDPYDSNTQPYTDERQPEDYRPNYEGDQKNYSNYPPLQRGLTQKSTSGLSREGKPSVSVVPVRKQESGFDQGEFTPTPKTHKNRTPRALKEYRYDHQGNLWAKGGRCRCVGRVCCCTLMTTVFLIVSIVLALALWVRPPSIQIGSVETIEENGAIIQQMSDGVKINLGVNISVSNPNYFSVDFKKIQAEIIYPIKNTPIGGGNATDIIFKSTSQTNFTFPFSLVYNSTLDSGGQVIVDLATKCGVNGGTKTNINVNYKITLGIRILLVTISPVISNQFNFPCPLKASDISKFLGGSN